VEHQTPDPERTSDAFIRHVAHDLRASLNAVVGWAELVKAGQLPPDEMKRAGDTIVRHARHLSQRLGDALDLWRLDVALLQLSARPTTVAAAVRAAVDQARPQFESRRVECALDVHADGIAHIDGQRLVQALVVLLADSAANTPAGQRVEVSLSTQQPSGLVIRVIGAGHLPDASAFGRNPLETRPNANARPFDFGLSLARTLIELNGGVLDFWPVGERIAFDVRLPTAESGPPAHS
jgi:K+-sensing histidine kinase KdpD